jgi:hypothetical protein
MSIGIDQIFEMLSWENKETIQLQGIEEAKKIKHLSVLIQPIESKSVWENCAKVLISKEDQELKMYLISMFKWLQDMTWPGADLIYERLKRMPKESIEFAYNACLSMAAQTEDLVWKKVLLDFWNDL